MRGRCWRIIPECEETHEGDHGEWQKRSIDRRFYENYLQKAEEMLDVAKYAIGASESNTAVDLMTEKQAADAVRRASRVLSKVRQKLQ